MSKPVATKKESDKKFMLLPVAPVVFFFLHNLNQYKELILTIDVLLLLLVYSVSALIIYTGIKKILRLSFFQSIFLSTVIMSFFLFFGALQDFFFQFKKYPYLSNSFLLFILYLLAIFIILVLIKKKKLSLVKPARYLALVFITVTSIEIILLGITIYKGKTVQAITHRMESHVLDDLKIDSSGKPDIYHILFDSYTNAPALNQFWGYDDDIYPFLNSKGFFTVDSGFSNYTSTPYSITSIFNLQYLPGAEPYLYSNSSNFYLGQRAFNENALFRFLKKNRYKLSIYSQLENERMMLAMGFLSVLPPSNWLRNQTFERIFMNPWMMDKLKSLFSNKKQQPSTIIKSMEDFTNYNKKALDHILSDCQSASKSGVNAGQIFSFTHILLPHDPYLLDENGNPVKSPQPGGIDMKGYLGQIKYSNKLIKQITTCLLSDTTRKKIIIFQGDHGYRHFDNAPSSAQFGALNAIYFYNKNYTGLKKVLSHVNTYRVVINNFFNGHLVLLKDTTLLLHAE
jgi:hypothetical protein